MCCVIGAHSLAIVEFMFNNCISHMVTNVFAVDLWLCFPGYYDVGLNRGFEISFEVLPDRINHNGPLFSMGTDEFQYYE